MGEHDAAGDRAAEQELFKVLRNLIVELSRLQRTVRLALGVWLLAIAGLAVLVVVDLSR